MSNPSGVVTFIREGIFVLLTIKVFGDWGLSVKFSITNPKGRLSILRLFIMGM